MIVVADSSPLIHLSVLGRLQLLRELYGTVLVPRAVYDEVVVAGEGEPGSREVASAGWIEVRDVVMDESWAALEARLDPGEAAAIALALDLRADLLVVDDRAGRREAAAAAFDFTAPSEFSLKRVARDFWRRCALRLTRRPVAADTFRCTMRPCYPQSRSRDPVPGRRWRGACLWAGGWHGRPGSTTTTSPWPTPRRATRAPGTGARG